MLDTTTGEVVKMTLKHEGNNVREFYSTLPRPVRVGIEATGSMQWFVNLLEELGIECLVGHPAEIRAAEPRKQKHDRRDADLILKLLEEDRFPAIWMPSQELQDLRSLLRHRHQWVRLRTRIQKRCSRSPWRMVYDEVPLCGARTDKTGSHRCRWRPIPLIGGASCRRCTRSSKRRSRN
jgi:transposase